MDICCIGHVTKDTVITPYDTRELPGGTAVYFSHALAHLGHRYQLVTALGASDTGLLSGLRASGVQVRVLPSAHTVHFENRYGNDPDQRTQRVLQEADPFRARDLEHITAGVFHLGPLLAEDIPAEVIRLLATKGDLSLDVQGFLRRVQNARVVPTDWAAKRELLPFFRYLKASEEEMRVLTGQDSPLRGARVLHEWGAREVIITMGSKGSLIYNGEHIFDIPAFPPRTDRPDVTGCGDTYMAGYLLSRLQGASEAEAGAFGAAMATLKIEAGGPFTGTPQEVGALLARHAA
ncbi:PfkB family carbohydrate kinase [Dinghuibacter silviterrae]|uniref:Sugar/nucleoside kinase (Ribokinase family) n=1 Tax=Dinghuibacter silviterrae TaxID=1539049 RepID=A0A4V3GM43_9BACT|nr:PfkB family carbohydrate kinase [Dinghuibacter silviterrae]TDX01993.1 sugar/nucleoside kinase (ribokinase family) [Dinghuibacter silviterrae]